jgi:hypothetical protein
MHGHKKRRILMATHTDSKRQAPRVRRDTSIKLARKAKNVEHFLAERGMQRLIAEHNTKAGA